MTLELLRSSQNFTLGNMDKRVVVIDYGVGNLLGVRRSIEFLGREVERTLWPTKFSNADRDILMGRGHLATK